MPFWVQVSSGRGPEECCLAVLHFSQFLLKEITKLNGIAKTIEAEPSSIKNNLLSCLIRVENVDVSQLEKWKGTIKWICKSPYRPNHGRKNWFFNVQIYVEPSENIGFKESDILIETFRATGPGGQHVNKTESAIRITHTKTGIMVTAREERSQHANKKLALAKLSAQIKAMNESNKKGYEKLLWQQHTELELGSEVAVFKNEKFILSS